MLGNHLGGDLTDTAGLTRTFFRHSLWQTRLIKAVKSVRRLGLVPERSFLSEYGILKSFINIFVVVVIIVIIVQLKVYCCHQPTLGVLQTKMKK